MGNNSFLKILADEWADAGPFDRLTMLAIGCATLFVLCYGILYPLILLAR